MNNETPKSWKKLHKPKTDKEFKAEMSTAEDDHFKKFMVKGVVMIVVKMICFFATIYIVHEFWEMLDG